MSAPEANANRRSPWTHVLVASCAVFIFTVFLMVAAAVSGPAATMSRFFDRHGILVLGIEVGAILGLAVVVLAVERRETRRQIEERERSLRATAESAAESRESETAGRHTRSIDE